MSDPVWYPPDDWRVVKLMRFLNLLDDAHNVASPVKFNLWSANLVTVAAGAATVLAWIGQHLPHWDVVAAGWTPLMTWLGHAHFAHAGDKKERNRQSVRMKENP
ncbi:MAG: hypothetical protein ISS15_05280 [Alphaproteobacteria bacterium]|nr:hypothetical protein [Alphaproteobacteria bacterium]MBL6939468.1 hypothetical protein [Alphaproteobacteria bacterium]MBL7097051.1 hypothetical protein [Alphaproteobacteria bacterium]